MSTDYKTSIFRQLGASNHCDDEREKNDYYATEPRAVQLFLNKLEEENIQIDKNLWECAVGGGHIKGVLQENGYNVCSSDIVNRTQDDDVRIIDFLSLKNNPFPGRDIITNPPYSKALDFLEKGYELIETGKNVILFLKIQFLEGIKRNSFFKKTPPKFVFVHSSRVKCAKNGDFDKYKSSAVCYAWFVFEKGYTGETVLKWID